MYRLGTVIQKLMNDREMTGVQVAEAIGLSPTSVSKLARGISKPRQLTFTRLVKVLCKSQADEQLMIAAFESIHDTAQTEPKETFQPLPQDEVQRVTRYMETKSMAIAFNRDVQVILKKMDLRFEVNYRRDPFICDFLLKSAGRTIALDCKFNVNRDWDRTVTSVSLLIENLSCDEVIIVVPYENDLARENKVRIEANGGHLVELSQLSSFISKNHLEPQH